MRRKASSIFIGEQEFQNKKALTKYIRELIDKQPTEVLFNLEQTVFFKNLLQRHPKALEKIGTGVEGFICVPGDHKYPTMMVLRSDGTLVDFSTGKCLSGDPPRKTKVAQAFRHAVLDEISEFRRGCPIDRLDRCPYTDELLLTVDCHVDHQPPRTFQALLDVYLMREGLSVDVLEIRDLPRGGYELVSPKITESWQQFHRKYSQLRLVSKTANLSQIRKELSHPECVQQVISGILEQDTRALALWRFQEQQTEERLQRERAAQKAAQQAAKAFEESALRKTGWKQTESGDWKRGDMVLSRAEALRELKRDKEKRKEEEAQRKKADEEAFRKGMRRILEF